MRLTGVTISGADDGVTFPSLLALSAEFPFVEWGVLVSGRSGRPRYPSVWWLAGIRGVPGVRRYAYHACGQESRALQAGGPDLRIDRSGGRGVRGEFAPMPGCKVGYAGGIGPDNVVEVLDRLETFGHTYWIDMESGVRTADQFDLHKVWRVLDLAAPFVAKDA